MIYVVYCDSAEPDRMGKNIVGDKRFSEIVYKRSTLAERTRKSFELLPLVRFVMDENPSFPESGAVIVFDSHIIVTREDEFLLLVEKLQYSKVNVSLTVKGTPVMRYFINTTMYHEYLHACENLLMKIKGFNDFDSVKIECSCLADISDYNNFITFFSGGFSARYFNTLESNGYTVTKRSSDKKKIKMEHDYFYLLPAHMQSWFVQPFDYSEQADFASYTMERYNMADMALKVVHGSITPAVLSAFLEKAMHFITLRKRKKLPEKETQAIRNDLYIQKVKDRLNALKLLPEYESIAVYISNGTKYPSLDDIFERYFRLHEKSQKITHPDFLAVSHGDFCFSNILYDNDTGLMRLIDPKGALHEDDLYLCPYYDVAKLSHSICGLYDFFNNDLYLLEFNDSLNLDLKIDFENISLKKMFCEYITKAGFDYRLTRLYEASLFLSMLPLHIDNPKKVLGFILNAVNILNEVEDLWSQ